MSEQIQQRVVDGYAEAKNFAAGLVAALSKADVAARITSTKLFPNGRNGVVTVHATDPKAKDDRLAVIEVHAVHDTSYSFTTRHRIKLSLDIPWSQRNSGVKSTVTWIYISDKATASIVERVVVNMARQRDARAMANEKIKADRLDVERATAISATLAKMGVRIDGRQSSPRFTVKAKPYDIEVQVKRERLYLSVNSAVGLVFDDLPLDDAAYCAVKVDMMRERLSELLQIAKPGSPSLYW